ncbi:MAG: flagellar hook-associated protein FlgL [candidate division Zixibacteria bacterium]|nr:flagellar hook-associated protein FlgL [candidate division Zixibacteria bacterium]
MRVTNAMISGTVVFNLQRSMSRFLDLQTQSSSGRRINKPSDDPLGTLRDMEYRTQLSKIEQYQSNISQGKTWLSTYDNTLSDVSNLLSEVKEIVVAMSNDTVLEGVRQSTANDIRAIQEQLLSLANTQTGRRNIFSGFKTTTPPLQLTNNGAIYRGDNGAIQFEIDSGVRQTVNLTADKVFLASLGILGENADLNVGVTDNTLLADLHGGSGVDLTTGTFTVADVNSALPPVTIDLTGAVTVGDAITAINTQLTAGGITNLTASISADGNSISLDTTETGLISGATPLKNLNSGNGIDLEPGKILVTDDAGINVQIDFSGAATVDDVITAFNTQMIASGVNNVTMGLNATGTGFEINDTNGVPLNLSVRNMNVDEETASDLGIVGTVAPSLTGADLNPRVDFDIQDVGGTAAADLGIAGELFTDFTGTDIDPQLTVDSRLSDLKNLLGLGGGEIVINQGEHLLRIDTNDATLVTVQDFIDRINGSALDVTAEINDAGTGIQIINNDPYRTLTIEDEQGSAAAREMGLYGAGDMIGALMMLTNALENDDREAVSLLLEPFDQAISHTLGERATIGTSYQRIESTSSRLLDLNLEFTRLLSEVEDADLTRVITDLATQENNYQAALMSAAKIIQPSLLNFMS